VGKKGSFKTITWGRGGYRRDLHLERRSEGKALRKSKEERVLGKSDKQREAISRGG